MNFWKRLFRSGLKQDIPHHTNQPAPSRETIAAKYSKLRNQALAVAQTPQEASQALLRLQNAEAQELRSILAREEETKKAINETLRKVFGDQEPASQTGQLKTVEPSSATAPRPPVQPPREVAVVLYAGDAGESVVRQRLIDPKEDSVVKGICRRVAAHLFAQGIPANVRCTSLTDCTIEATIEGTAYRISVVNPDEGLAIAEKMTDSGAITLAYPDNPNPSDTDQRVTQLCDQINQGRFAPSAAPVPGSPKDIPFRTATHRKEGFSFQHPSQWVKVYDPDYRIFPAGAERVRASPGDNANNLLINPSMLILSGQTTARGREAENNWASFLRRQEVNFEAYEQEENSLISLPSGVQRFEYRYSYVRGGRRWRSVASEYVSSERDVDIGGSASSISVPSERPFVYLEGTCLIDEWPTWEAVFRRFTDSVVFL